MKQLWSYTSLGVLTLLALAVIPAVGQEWELRARLTGFEEVPAIVTTGTGEFSAKIDATGTTITYTLRYSHLEGTTTTAAHIHVGQRAVAGGVSAFLCGGGGKPACPPTSGTVTGIITAADVRDLPLQGVALGELGDLLRAIRSGNAYVNVHSLPTWPGGEIRGQIKVLH